MKHYMERNEFKKRLFNMSIEKRLYTLQWLPKQLVDANKIDPLYRTLSDLNFIEAKCQADMIYDLLDDYQKTLDHLPSDQYQTYRRTLKLLSDVIRDESHNLVLWKELTRQQLLPFLGKLHSTYHKGEDKQGSQAISKTKSRTTEGNIRKIFSIFVRYCRNLSRELCCWNKFANEVDVRAAVEYAEMLAAAPERLPEKSFAITSIKEENRQGFLLRLNPSFSRTDVSVIVCRGHRGPVNVVVSYGADYVVSAGADGTVRLWELATTKQLAILQLCQHSIIDLQLFPNTASGVALCQECGPIYFDLQAKTFQLLSSITKRIQKDIAAVAWGNSSYKACKIIPGSEKLLVACGPAFWMAHLKRGTILGPLIEDLQKHADVWNAGHLPDNFLNMMAGAKFGDITCVALDFERPLALIGYTLGGVLLWDLELCRVRSYLPYCWRITHAVFRKKDVLMGTIDPKTKLTMEITAYFNEHEELYPISHGHIGQLPIARTRNGILCGCTNWGLNFYIFQEDDVKSNKKTLLNNHHESIQCATVESSGKWAATGGEDGTIRIWNLQEKVKNKKKDILWKFCRIIDYPRQVVVISQPLGPTSSLYHSIQFMSLPDRGERRFLVSFRIVDRFFDLSRDGVIVSCAARPQSIFDEFVIHLWNLVRFKPIPNEERVSHLVIWNPDSGIATIDLAVGQGAQAIHHASLSPDGSMVACLLDDGSGIVYNIPKNQICRFSNPEMKALCLFARSDTQPVLLGIAGNSIALFDWKTCAFLPVWSNPHGGTFTTVATSIKNASFLLGDETGRLAMWNAEEKKLLGYWKAHEGAVIECRISETGDYAISCGEDRLNCLWELSTQYILAKAPCHTPPVSCDVSGNGQFVTAVDTTGHLYVWEYFSESQG